MKKQGHDFDFLHADVLFSPATHDNLFKVCLIVVSLFPS